MRLFQIFLFLSSLSVFSQTEGYVYDLKNKPLSQVDVFLPDQGLLLNTDEKGMFVLDEELVKNSYIEFSKFGYASKMIKYQNSDNLIVFLQKLHVELDEIGIQEKYSFLGNNKTLNIEHKSLVTNFISSTSLVENISQLPGLNLIGSGLGIQKVVIRGLSGLRVVSYLNGMRISNQEWANDHGIGFTDLGLGDVELIKGGSALKYGGDAVGGVLYFKDYPFVTSEVASGFVATKFDNSHFLFSNQFGLQWSRKNFYLNTYGQHSISSDYRLPDKTYLYNSRLRNQSFKFSIANINDKLQNIFRYQYNSEQLGIPAHVHGDVNGVTLESLTLNTLYFPEDFEPTRPTQYINNHLFTLESKYFTGKMKYSIFLGHFINNLQEWEKHTLPAFDMNLSTTTFRLNSEIPFKFFDINTGLQYQRQQNINNINSFLIPDGESNEYSLYTTVDYEKKYFGFNSGFRIDHKQIICDDYNYNQSFRSFNSSTGFFYKKNKYITRITYSGSYRVPHLSELFTNGLHHGTMRFEIGDVNLDIEKSHQFDVKYQWNNDHLGFVINPFLQLINDFISITPTDSLYQNIYRIFNYTQFNEVQMSGCEFNLHYHPHFLHNLHFEQSYSFLKALNKDDDLFLALTPSNKIKTRVSLNLSSYNIPLSLQKFQIFHLYSFVQENVASYESATKSYNVFNMEFLFNPFEKMIFNFTINNLFNEEYVPHLSRIKDVAGGVPNPGRSFIFSCKYNF